jgi:MFS family permease
MRNVVSPDTIISPRPQEPPERAKNKGKYVSYVVFILFVATLLNGLDSSEFTSASTVIARELHLGIGDIGVLASAFTIFLTISIIPIGLWADRAKRSHIIGACVAVWSLATALTGLATGFLGLFLTRMFTGIGEAGYVPAGNSMVGDVFREDQRAKVMSWLALATLIGPILGMVLGGVIAGLAIGAWRWAFFITGIPGLLLALAAWRLREPARLKSMQPSVDVHTASISGLQPGEILTHFRKILHNKPLVCLIIYGVLTAYTATALQSYFPTLLQQHDTLGLTSGQAATYSGLALGPTALVGVLIGGYLSGWLSRRYRGANMLVCVISVVLTAPLNIATLIVMGTTHNMVLFTALMVPSFLINTLHIGPMSAAVLDVSPVEQRASAMAIFIFVQRILGTAMAPLVIGALTSSFDPSGLHFLHNVAGHDLILSLVSTCPIAFIGASIVGIMGLRWIQADRKENAGDTDSESGGQSNISDKH